MTTQEQKLLARDRRLYERQKRLEAAQKRIEMERKTIHQHLDPLFSDDVRTLAIDGYSLRRDRYEYPTYQVSEALKRGSDAVRDLVRQAADMMMQAGFGKINSGFRYVPNIEVTGK